MAKNDKEKEKKIQEINKKYSNVLNKMEDVYQSTYSSRMTNTKELNNVTSDIYDTVDKVLSANSNISGIPNLSRTYSRLYKKNGGSSENISDENFNGIMDLFNDKQVLNNINIDPELNRYINYMDSQYDLICKYMPKLEEALDIKKDNVLSSDSFVKEFLNVSKANSIDHELFVSRDKELKEKHDLDNLIEEIYRKTSKYGEYFLYCVPYKRALEQLLKNKNSSPQSYAGNISTKSYFETSSVICENGSFLESSDDSINSADLNINKELSVTINFDNSGLLSESVLAYQRAEKTKESLSNKFRSVHETFISESAGNKSIKLDKIMADELDYDDAFKSAQDGTINVTSNNDIKINDIPGCILKEIERDKIKPIYVEKTCMGYYYIKCKNNGIKDSSDVSTATGNSFNSISKSMISEDDDKIMKYISAKIASAIDSNFINSNVDLKDDIYSMLKYNDEFNINSANDISVTFLPPEDVFHIYFELDKKTHRGISDLHKALIPAMFWCLLDLSTTIGIVTRSQDKRIYYVKQNIEKNTSRTLMNVVNQVKKGNMGIRQIDSMNNMINAVGRYNDHVIPTNSAGDSPITFDIMQGQTIEIPMELMNKWEESSINSTDVPLELVNSVMNIDYAIRYTMQNSKFLRKVFKRQFVCEKVFSKIYTRIYNYEYNDTETQIKVTLPAPMFLSMSNGSQLINNTREWCEGIANMEYTEDSDEKKEFIRLLMRHTLPSYIDIPLIENMKSKAKINIVVDKKTEEDN